MFEAIGMIVVWVVGLALFLMGPMLVGMIISDRRRDDGAAAFASVPVGILCGMVYGLITITYFIIT